MVANPSRPPSFKAYGVKPVCSGCGKKLNADEPLWFVGAPRPGVFCSEPGCRKAAARA